jgi:hypothetical protein
MMSKFSIQLTPDSEPIIVEAADQYAAYEKALQQTRQAQTATAAAVPETTIAQDLITGAQKRLRQAGEGVQGTLMSAQGALGMIPQDDVRKFQEGVQFNRSVFSPEYGKNEPKSISEYVGGAGLDILGMVGAGGALRGAGSAIGAVAPKVGSALQYAGQSIMAPKTVPQAALGGAALAQTYPYASEAERAVGTGSSALISGVAQPLLRAVGLAPPKETQLTAQQAESAKRGIEAGMQYSPAQMTGSRTGRMLEEGLKAMPLSGGPFAELARANQNVVNEVAAKAVGLPSGTEITPAVMKSAYDDAFKNYSALTQVPKTTLDVDFRNSMDKILYDLGKLPASQRGEDVNKAIKIIQEYKGFTNKPIDGDTMYQGLKAISDNLFQASKEGKITTGAYSQLRSEFENAIERKLQSGNLNVAPDVLDQFKSGRSTLANWFTVDKALDPNTGLVSGPKLATALARKSDYGMRGTEMEAAAMGSKAVPNVLPSSGTTERAEATGLIKKVAGLPAMLGGGATGAITQDPYMAALGAAAAEGIPYIASKALTSEPVRSIVARRQLGAVSPDEGLLARAFRGLEENIPADIRAQFGNVPRSVLERMMIKGLLGE